MNKYPTCTNHFDETYLNNLACILRNGEERTDRTGTGTISMFGGINMRFDIREKFPLLTTKAVHFKSIAHELIWMLSGSTNIRYLKENGVRIWDEWVLPETAEYHTLSWSERVAKLKGKKLEEYNAFCETLTPLAEHEAMRAMEAKLAELKVPERELIAGELGPVYGAQWRNWEDLRIISSAEFYSKDMWEAYGKRDFKHLGNVGPDLLIGRSIDQIARIEHQLQNQRDSRRIILSGWNVAKIDEMALPPCHTLAQWYVSVDGFLDCKLYQRSGDFFLGIPFNIAQYALLTNMLAHAHGLTPRYFYHTVGDAHIYSNHKEQVREQLKRSIRHHSPTLKFNCEPKSITEMTAQDFEIVGYEHQPAISAPVAV